MARAGSSDKLRLRVSELSGNNFVPIFMNLFIIIDEANDLAPARADTGVAGMRQSLVCFLHIDDSSVLTLKLTDYLLRIVFAVVVTNDEGNVKANRNRGAHQARKLPAATNRCDYK